MCRFDRDVHPGSASARLGGAALTLEGLRIPHHKFKCHARFCSSSNLAGSFGLETWRQWEKGQRQINAVSQAPCGYCQFKLNTLVDVPFFELMNLDVNSRLAVWSGSALLWIQTISNRFATVFRPKRIFKLRTEGLYELKQLLVLEKMN